MDAPQTQQARTRLSSRKRFLTDYRILEMPERRSVKKVFFNNVFSGAGGLEHPWSTEGAALEELAVKFPGLGGVPNGQDHLDFIDQTGQEHLDFLRRVVVVETIHPRLPDDFFDRSLASLITKKRFPKLETVVWVSASQASDSSSWSR